MKTTTTNIPPSCPPKNDHSPLLKHPRRSICLPKTRCPSKWLVCCCYTHVSTRSDYGGNGGFCRCPPVSHLCPISRPTPSLAITQSRSNKSKKEASSLRIKLLPAPTQIRGRTFSLCAWVDVQLTMCIYIPPSLFFSLLAVKK